MATTGLCVTIRHRKANCNAVCNNKFTHQYSRAECQKPLPGAGCFHGRNRFSPAPLDTTKLRKKNEVSHNREKISGIALSAGGSPGGQAYTPATHRMTTLYSSTRENWSMPTPQSGQVQSSGNCSKGIPGEIPPSGSPDAGSYTHPHTSHTYFFIIVIFWVSTR